MTQSTADPIRHLVKYLNDTHSWRLTFCTGILRTATCNEKGLNPHKYMNVCTNNEGMLRKISSA